MFTHPNDPNQPAKPPSTTHQAVVEILTFRTPTNLRVLHFFNNMSGDGGAEALASLMEHAPLLEDLRFSGTRAGPKGSLVRGLWLS